MDTPPFTLEGYAATVSGLIARGYRVASLWDCEPLVRDLVLRHDIDQSIARARELALREAAEGWRAAYFVLLRTEMYNPWSRASMQSLREMSAAGHEIGLHLDATLYGSEADLQAGAAAECRSLEDLIGAPVRLVSFHRPARERIGGETLIAGRMHTYMDRFMTSMGYCSDSRGGWHHGHPWDHPAVRESRALQLLTHAVWWVGPGEQTPRERLVDVAHENARRIEAELAANNDVWR